MKSSRSMVAASANHQFSVQGFSRVAVLPVGQHVVPAVEGGDQARQIVGLDRLLVVGVQLEAVIAGVQENHPFRAPAFGEHQNRGLHPE